jgi:hypothetical protein
LSKLWCLPPFEATFIENQIRNYFGAPTGGVPLFDRRLTLKSTCAFLRSAPQKQAFIGAKFRVGEGLGRCCGAAG